MFSHNDTKHEICLNNTQLPFQTLSNDEFKLLNKKDRALSGNDLVD
jgi:hypothetical protein